MRAYLVGLSVIVTAAAIATPAQAQVRAEIHGGYDRIGDDEGVDDSGVVYGIGLGYDRKVGNKAFIGADFSLDDSTQKECETGAIVANDELCLRAGRDLAAGIRAGVMLGERSKLYALAAYTNARFRGSYTTPAGVETREGGSLEGFRVGAGYQHGFGSNAFAKVEYRYSNYEAGVDRHQVLFGLGLEF